VGLPDEKWGQSVTAVVSLVDGPDDADADDRPDGAALIAHAKEHLAGYKCPKRVVLVEAIQRGPNGKPDYRWAAEVATAGRSSDS
jgi:fatty-acyl-CoA synthase